MFCEVVRYRDVRRYSPAERRSAAAETARAKEERLSGHLQWEDQPEREST
jgi:hypothetical protein